MIVQVESPRIQQPNRESMAQKAHILCHYSQVQTKRRIGRTGDIVAEVFVISRATYGFAFICLLAVIALSMTSCGGNVGIHSGNSGGINCGGCGSTGNGGGLGSVTTVPVTLSLLDPPTCASPRGSGIHLYLSIAGVQLNPDANATATSAGWVDVAPNLATAPKQMDLFSQSPSIGNLLTSSAAVGNYGSLRLLLAANSQAVTANQCGGQGVNCLVTTTSTTPINVSTENTQGIVLNSSSIAGAQIPVAAPGSNVNILFDSCSSLIGDSTALRLLPNVKAWGGAIQTYSVTLSDAVSFARLGGGSAIVALEQTDASGGDGIFAQATPDTSGIATLFGPQGTFDLVAVATGVSGGANTMYSPLVVTAVQGAGGTTPISMLLTPQGIADPGTIQQLVQSNVPIDFRTRVQQAPTIGGTLMKKFTIPLLNGNSGIFAGATAAGSGCTTPACLQANLSVPSQPLFVQTFGSTTVDMSSTPIAYSTYTESFISQGSAVKNCTTNTIANSVDTVGGAVSPIPGGIVVANPITFSGCQ
jgi:hypothetical protein